MRSPFHRRKLAPNAYFGLRVRKVVGVGDAVATFDVAETRYGKRVFLQHQIASYGTLALRGVRYLGSYKVTVGGKPVGRLDLTFFEKSGRYAVNIVPYTQMGTTELFSVSHLTPEAA